MRTQKKNLYIKTKAEREFVLLAERGSETGKAGLEGRKFDQNTI